MPASLLLHLNLRQTGVGDKGGVRLADALPSNRHLRTLDLMHNSLGNDTAAALASGLLENNALTALKLRDNKIGSRESGEGIEDQRGESSDGWECLAHSPLHELRSLLLQDLLHFAAV